MFNLDCIHSLLRRKHNNSSDANDELYSIRIIEKNVLILAWRNSDVQRGLRRFLQLQRWRLKKLSQDLQNFSSSSSSANNFFRRAETKNFPPERHETRKTCLRWVMSLCRRMETYFILMEANLLASGIRLHRHCRLFWRRYEEKLNTNNFFPSRSRSSFWNNVKGKAQKKRKIKHFVWCGKPSL